MPRRREVRPTSASAGLTRYHGTGSTFDGLESAKVCRGDADEEEDGMESWS